MSEPSIWIVSEVEPSEPDETSGEKSARSTNPFSRTVERVSAATVRSFRVSSSKLEEKMSEFLQVIERVFNSVEQNVNPSSGFHLDEVELSVEITGEGEVKLIGAGGKSGTKGAITLKFKRADLE